VINEFAYNLGVPRTCVFNDVYGLDDDMLGMVPQPCYAMLLLFPITKTSEEDRKEERIAKEGQTIHPSVFYTKQTIGNACGTIALIHSLCNCADEIGITGGFFRTFIETTKNMTADERAGFLEDHTELEESHEKASKEGQTKAPPVDDDVNLHFIAFIRKQGHIYEMDGRKHAPINHGNTNNDTFLKDVVGVIKRNFIDRNPNEVNFTMIALTAAASD